MITSLAARTLGKYDMRRVHVFLQNHDDPSDVPITRVHEWTHWFLIRKSSFGHLMLDLRRKIDSSKKHADREKYRGALSYLCENSLVLQEAAATYVSLVGHDAVDRLIERFPIFYRRCFLQMDQLVSHWFGAPSPRCWMANVVAILSLSPVSEPFSIDSDMPDLREAIGVHDLPDWRFRRICDSMARVPAADMVRTIRKLWSGWDDYVEDMEARQTHRFGTDLQIEGLLAHALFRFLGEEFPEAEAQWSASNMQWMVLKMSEQTRVASDPVGAHEALQATNYLAEVTAPGVYSPPNRILPRDARVIENISERSRAFLGAAFIYGSCTPSIRRVFLCDLVRGKSVLDLVPVHLRDIAELVRSGLQPITILEEEWWKYLHRKSPISGRIVSHLMRGPAMSRCGQVFFHIHDNPIVFVRELVKFSRPVNWISLGLAYSTDIVRKEHGLAVILYWFASDSADVSQFFFHIATHEAAAALDSYFSLAHMDTVFAIRDVDMVPVSPQALTMLADHSVFFNYHLANRALV